MPRAPLGGAQRPPVGGTSSKGSGRESPARQNRADPNGEFDLTQLDKLDKMMLVVSCLGLVINVVQIVAISNQAWLVGTALYDGQPFTSYLSLGSATFGNATHPTKDNRYFCGAETECSLRTLCSRDVSNSAFPNGMKRFTQQEDWCKVLSAGSLATRFLFFGLLLGLGVTGFTGMYSAQAIPWVAEQFDKIEELGFVDEYQKYLIGFGWAALWLFVFGSMMTYALTIPDSLGWGDVELEASFGMLRVCFVLSSVQVALVANSIFHIWPDDALPTAWKAFVDTPWLSFKKALYFELALQQIAYFLLVVSQVDWACMLVVLAWIYLHGGSKAFYVMYAGFTVVSILFDSIELAELPAFNTMGQGELFVSIVWIVIFAFKPIIVGTMIAYDRLETQQDAAGGDGFAQFDRGDDGYDEEAYEDERLAS